MSQLSNKNLTPLQTSSKIISDSEGDDHDEKEQDDPFGYKLQKPKTESPPPEFIYAINPFLQTKIVTELIGTIQPETWFNIPVPLVKSTKAFCEIFKILEKRLYELTNIQNQKQLKQNNNVKRIEKAILDQSEFLLKKIEYHDRELQDKFSKFQHDVTNKIGIIEMRFEELSKKVQNDREFVDTRLSRIDDSAVIKNWVENLMIRQNQDLQEKIELVEKTTKAIVQKMMDDNLIIPGLIGNGERYTNLKEYITHQKIEMQNQISDLELKMQSQIQQEVKNSKRHTEQEILKTRTHLDNLLQQYNQQTNATLFEKLQNSQKRQEDQNDKIYSIEQQLNEMLENQFQNQQEFRKDFVSQIQYSEMVEDIKKLEELNKNIKEEHKNSEAKNKKQYNEIVKIQKDFEQKMKKRLDELTKQLVNTLKNTQDQEGSQLNGNLQNNLAQNTQKQKQSIENKKSIIDKISQDGSKQRTEKQSQEGVRRHANDSSLRESRQENIQLPANYKKEIERMIESRLTMFKQNYQKKDSMKLQENQNFMIGYQPNFLQNSNKHSDIQSMKSGGSLNFSGGAMSVGIGKSNYQLRKSFIHTQQSFKKQDKEHGVNDQYEQNQKVDIQPASMFNPMETQNQKLETDQAIENQQVDNNNMMNQMNGFSKRNDSEPNDMKVKFIQHLSPKSSSPYHGFQDQDQIFHQTNYQDLQISDQNQSLRNFQDQQLNIQEQQSNTIAKDYSDGRRSKNLNQIRYSSQEQKRPHSKNREQIQNITLKTIQTIRKYEQDVRNSFRIPPILSNNMRTSVVGGVMMGASGVSISAIGDDTSRNALNYSGTIDNQVSRSYTFTQQQTAVSGKRQVNNLFNQTLPLSVKFENLNNRFDH